MAGAPGDGSLSPSPLRPAKIHRAADFASTSPALESLERSVSCSIDWPIAGLHIKRNWIKTESPRFF